MYIITNKGLDVLEETGLKKIIDSSLDDLLENIPKSYMYDEIIEEYSKEHGIPGLLEKVKSNNSLNTTDSFIMHSEIVCDLLKNKLPKNLEEDIKDAVSAYYIYYDKFLKMSGYRGRNLWRDEKFLNIIEGTIHGDMAIQQYDISPGPQLNLFGEECLVKKTDLILLNGYYTEWIKTLADFMTFCCQINKPVPFKDNWKEVFYDGNFKETEPGEVARQDIEHLKCAKEGKKFGWIKVLPFLDNPLKHINPKKDFFHTDPVCSENGYYSQPFIDKDNLVYLHETKNGVKFLEQIWGNPGIKFNYKQIGNCIKSIVKCIQGGASRSLPQDPGLVFKYFPYKKFMK